MNFHCLYINDHANNALHELAHGLVALSANVTKSVILFSDAAVIDWKMDEVNPAQRIQVHVAGLGANDYVANEANIETVKDLYGRKSVSVWDHDRDVYDWETDPNSDFSKADDAYHEMLDAGVLPHTAAKLAARGRLKGALFAHMAHYSGLLSEVTNHSDDFLLTKTHLLQCFSVIPQTSVEDMIDACFD
ncbi:hypothetical protein [Ruegeria profundi]|uniref:hypothetical protein n=1 Tax=Ruegeria profundi TaxID=1685378 RepID=UPI001CD5D9AD|nr:hypothetical protein [Ruegeria profundi]MCA0927147.1 hypothetical protein [Ruegeria profundi]